MDLGLTGRGVIVTGGSSGIGLATIRLLLEEGAEVATCARNTERLHSAVAGLGVRYASGCNILEASETANFVDESFHKLGRIDAVVAVAGQGIRGLPLETPGSDWDLQVAGKVAALLNPVRSALTYLRLSDAARVVVIGSVTSTEPELELAASSAGQAATAVAAKTMAIELAPFGILVNIVAIGIVDTDRQRAAHRRSETTLDYDMWLEREVERRGGLLRRAANTEEIARQLVLLASPLTTYATAATFDVSGGMRRSL